MIGICKYDLEEGFKAIRVKLVFFVVLITWINYVTGNTLNMQMGDVSRRATLIDYIACVIGGPRYIPKGQMNSYVIPILWLAIYVVIAYTVGSYPTQDLRGYGQHILMRSEKRIRWWIGKCVWNSVVVVFMFCVLYGMTAINAMLHHARMSLAPTKEIVGLVAYTNLENAGKNEVAFVLLVMPVMVTLALSMLQMAIELIIVPIAGFFVSQSIVFLSTMYTIPVLFVNYAILPHNSFSSGSSIHTLHGPIVCILVYAVTFIIGAVYFERCDIR